jgi:hypothetical protein
LHKALVSAPKETDFICGSETSGTKMLLVLGERTKVTPKKDAHLRISSKPTYLKQNGVFRSALAIRQLLMQIVSHTLQFQSQIKTTKKLQTQMTNH